MAEKLLRKVRVDGIDFADPITTQAGIATAVWNPQPLTLRDDEVSIVESDPTESEIFSHENDAPEDYDVSGGGISAVGSFIKVTKEEMVGLMGGLKTGADDTAMYLHSSKKEVLNKAIRFRLKDGSAMILPNAKGSVQYNSNNGFDGILKFPFRFRALESGFDCDLIIQENFAE